MPYKRKDSPVWWVSVTGPDGKRIRRSAETEDRREAEALEAKWKLEAYRAKQWQEQPKRSFEELMLAYLTATTSKRSANKDRERTATLRRHLAGRTMNGLTATDIRSYIAKRRGEGVSDSTINRETSLLGAAINYANREWEWNLPNPVKGRKLKEPEGRVRWITRAEAGGLIQEAGRDPRADHLPDFIALALHTGCRRGELLGLEWKRVDLKENMLHLEGRHTKAGKRRSIPLNSTARAALLSRARFKAEHCPASPWVFANREGERITDVKKSFSTACRRAGIEDLRVHDLRHTCAAWLVTAGVPLSEVRDLLGHASVTMTERYAHLAPENVRAAVEKLEGESRSGHAGERERFRIVS